MTIELNDIPAIERQRYLQSAIAPRPIALASTISKNGIVNLAPFSFFNLFSIDPPVLIFSPSLRVRDGSRKHTLDNVEEVPEVVVHIVDEDMLAQVNQCSADYPEEIDEMAEVGFTAMTSLRVRPPRVKESRISFECVVTEVKPLGKHGGAGNLIICEILVMHMAENILQENGRIDQKKMLPVARLGADWYCRIPESALFELPKPIG